MSRLFTENINRAETRHQRYPPHLMGFGARKRVAKIWH